MKLTTKLQAHLSQVQTEREDVAARLYNAESVRDFLMKKLTDTEEIVADIRTACAKKDEQAALDHEIIGFLDAKTQECESALIEYAHQNSSLRIEIQQLRESHRSNTTVRWPVLFGIARCVVMSIGTVTTDYPRHGQAADRGEERA